MLQCTVQYVLHYVSLQYSYCNVTVQDVPHVAGLLQYNSFHTISSILYLWGTSAQQ